MTSYSLDTGVRQSVYLIIAALSIAASYALAQMFGQNQFYKVAAPSSGALFAVLLWAFDRFVWRLPPMPRALGIPNLNGEWQGVVNKPSSKSPLEVRMTITQTFHRFSLVLESANTRSKSEVAGLFVQDPRQMTVCYTYVVKHTSGFQAGTPYGQGTNELVLRHDNGATVLRGPYYSSHSKNGDVEVRLVESNRQT